MEAKSFPFAWIDEDCDDDPLDDAEVEEAEDKGLTFFGRDSSRFAIRSSIHFLSGTE
jgi:hypothetical protein